MTANVLHVVRPAQGGMKKHLVTLFEGLEKEGFALYLAAPASSDLTVVLRPFTRKTFMIQFDENNNPLQNWRAICSLAQIIRNEKIDLVHTHGVRAGMIGQTAALLARCRKVLATIHNMHNTTLPFANVLRILQSSLMRLAVSHTITVSETLKYELERHMWIPQEKTTVIYNGIDSDLFLSSAGISRAAVGIPEDVPVIGTVARLEPAKGIKYLLEAAYLIDKEYGPVYFLIVGDGPDRESLQQQARMLGIEEKVIFYGFSSDIPSLLPVFDIAAIPSLREGMSIFCLEALAAGLPVVASAVGGLTEIISPEKTGFLVPPGDPQALAETLLLLLHNREMAVSLGSKGKEMVVQYFTCSRMIEKTKEIYTMVLREGQE
ncbi:MAG: glycosyltransferase family 4 protein [Syntrophaceticus sp.]